MIQVNVDISEFFRDRLLHALSHHALDLSPSAEVYVVNLMTTYATTSAGSLLTRPLVEQLAAALEASGPERLRKYRDLGDTALYACGFFSDHLERRGVSRGYVVTMGHRAYYAASDLAVRTSLAGVYPELAASFERLAAVLDDVRESTALRTPQDIIRLYERWRRTRSPLLAERLEAEGVFPMWSADESTTVH